MLVATYVKTLPDVMRHMLTRMAPDVVDRVDFVGIHQMALRLLSDRGATVRLDSAKARAAFERAWQKVGQVVLMAEAELRRRPLDEPYGAVIVDEAQDLSCAMARLLYSLVGDAPDGLTLIGDGQQSIYPGGYTLLEAGISLAGRGVVLDINYRNTAQILAVASRLVVGDEFADIEGAPARGDVPATVPRSGVEPVIVQCAGWSERDRLLVDRVREVTREVGTGPGDVGVLCLTTRGVSAVSAALHAAGLPVVALADYDGVPVDAVKVGTVKRAKGLEFKQVLMADVPLEAIGGGAPPEDGAERERWELRRRELYVGMTRACDGLWVGAV